MSSTRHEKVYHATQGCQAATLSLTASRLRGLFWACQVENKKTAGFFVCLKRLSPDHKCLSGSLSMVVLCRLKGCRLIAFVLKPHSVDDAYPDVGKRAYSHTMTLALSSLAFVIRQCPGFLPGGLPGKLMQRIAQRLQASIALMGFGIIATLEGNGSRASQRLDTRTSRVARAIIAPFRKQARSQTLSRSRKTAEDLIVCMGQKKVSNLLVIGGDLLDQWQELGCQSQHQSRLGARGNRISMQLWLMQCLTDLCRDFARRRVPRLFEDARDFLDRSLSRCLKRGIGLQENQGRALLQFAEELQGNWIVGFQAGSQLIDHPRLTLHKAILIASQHFQFLDNGTIRSQFPQIRQI